MLNLRKFHGSRGGIPISLWGHPLSGEWPDFMKRRLRWLQRGEADHQAHEAGCGAGEDD